MQVSLFESGVDTFMTMQITSSHSMSQRQASTTLCIENRRARACLTDVSSEMNIVVWDASCTLLNAFPPNPLCKSASLPRLTATVTSRYKSSNHCEVKQSSSVQASVTTHFPMQNSVKIASSKSSVSITPVTRPRALAAPLNSSAANSSCK